MPSFPAAPPTTQSARSDRSGLLGSRPSHKSNVVHACREDEWANDELGRRILIYRNAMAHENPDHELWRQAEYEDVFDDLNKSQNLPVSADSPIKTYGPMVKDLRA